MPAERWLPHPAATRADCAADLAAASALLKTLDTTALLAAKDGRALLSHGPVARPSIVFSVRKSILALLYGEPVQQGKIDLDATLRTLGIDDVGGLLDVERDARVVDLLESRSGVYHPAANGGDDLAHAPPRGSKRPGEAFVYNNWDFNAAGTVFERATGRSVHDAFRSALARPLQLEDYDPRTQRKSGDRSTSEHLAYPFHLSTRDMARIGVLMLRQGQWNGAPVVPAAWVESLVQPRTRAAEMLPPATARRGLGYGRMWWLLEAPPSSPLAGGSLAWGVHGQFILVVPKHDLVIAHKRQVPVAGNWNVSWVRLADFLHVAERIASARCDAQDAAPAAVAAPDGAAPR